MKFLSLLTLTTLRSRLFLVLLLFSIHTQATVEVMAVNDLTKEIHRYESGNALRTGWIGWSIVGDGIQESEYQRLMALGYKETENPFKIEIALLVVVLTLLSFALYNRQKKWIIRKLK